MNKSVELPNVPKLKMLIDNFDKFKNPKWDKVESAKKLKMLKKLYQKCKKTNEIPTSYKFGKGKTKGRKFVKEGLQALPRMFKNTIADEYEDYDIVNAFPNFLQHYCNEQKIKCDALIDYNKNRSKYIQDHDFDVKDIVIQMINNGWQSFNKLTDKPKWLVKLKDCIKDIHSIMKKEKEYKKVHTENPMGTYMFSLLECIEAKLLDDMIDWLGAEGIDVSNIILMYDGFMLPIGKIKDEQFGRFQDYVATMGFQIIKKHMPRFDLNDIEPLPEYPETDYDAAVVFYNWLEGNDYRCVRVGDELFFYDKEQGIYVEDPKHELRRFVQMCDDLGEHYSKNTQPQNNIIKQFEVLVPIDRDFQQKKKDNTYRKLPFNNGIYDFEQGKLIPFSSDYYFFEKLKWDYDPNYCMDSENDIYDKILLGIFGTDELSQYWLKIIARAMAGEVFDKKAFFVLGESNSGKGVMMDLIKRTFGCFTALFDARNMAVKKSGGDSAKDNQWIIRLMDKRIIYSSEVDMTTSLNGVTVKTIFSGGDNIEARKMYKESKGDFIPSFTGFIFANDLPKIEPLDDGFKNRSRYIRTAYTHKNKKDYDRLSKKFSNIRLADPNIKSTFINNDNINQVFMYMVLNSYDLNEPIAPQCVIDEGDEWNENEDDNIEEYITNTFEKGEHSECITVNIINTQLKQKFKVSSRNIVLAMKKFGWNNNDRAVINGKRVKVYRNIKWSSQNDEVIDNIDKDL